MAAAREWRAGEALVRDALSRAGWERAAEVSTLEDMVEQGLLTRADAYEAAGILHLLLARVRRGEITEHFMELVLRKLATEKYAAWRLRLEAGVV